MIRLPPQNRESPIELLHDHHPRELVGERERTETPTRGRSGREPGRESVGSSDHQCHRSCSHAPTLDLPGQFIRAPGDSRSSERHHRASGRKFGAEPRGLLVPLCLDRGRAAGFPHLDLPESDVTAEPPGILVARFAVERPQPAHREQRELHLGVHTPKPVHGGDPLDRLHVGSDPHVDPVAPGHPGDFLE
jgi:hypothetical protein